MNRKMFLLGVLAGLCLAGLVRGQDAAPGFTEKPFRLAPAAEKHRAFWALVGLHGAVTVADIWSTQRLFKYQGVYELNPLLPRRPSAAEMALEFGAFSFAGALATHYMGTHGHVRLAKLCLIGTVGSEALAVGNNLVLHRREVANANR